MKKLENLFMKYKIKKDNTNNRKVTVNAPMFIVLNSPKSYSWFC